MAAAENKEARLVARVTEDVQKMIQRAADYSGTSISQFLTDSAMDKARTIIEKTEALHLSMQGADALFDALEAPPKANTKLLKAAKGFKGTVNVAEH
ncbi:DUF1778 domain-containing protein [Litoribacillus peritrichatus]|uniref:DUF1778 domain-containing protein n=1 Tax=Litoribacillus peritrichatus TaxID=718191 RepID=A0ABP7NAI0_9GAMM